MIDLDELEASIKDLLGELRESQYEAGCSWLDEITQELRLAREVVEAVQELKKTVIADLAYIWADELDKRLQAYNQHTEGKDTSGGLGETE